MVMLSEERSKTGLSPPSTGVTTMGGDRGPGSLPVEPVGKLLPDDPFPTNPPVGVVGPNPVIPPGSNPVIPPFTEPPTDGGVGPNPITPPAPNPVVTPPSTGTGAPPSGNIGLDDLRVGPLDAVKAPEGEDANRVGELSVAEAADAARAKTARAIGYNATTGEVDPTALASARLNEITSLDSANMQRAKMQGMLTAASRGLGESSIAAGAAQGAMVDRATPLALSEADAIQQQNLANQAVQNRASEFGAAAKNVAELQGAQLGTEVSMFNVSQENQQAQFNANWANQAEFLRAEMAQQNQQFNAQQQNAINSQIMQMNASLNEQYLRGTQSMDLATIQGQFNTIISQNETAGSFYNNAMSAIGQAMADPKMTPTQVAAFVRVQQDMIASGLSMMSDLNNIDFSNMGTNTTLPSARGESTPSVYTTGIPDVGSPEFSDWLSGLMGGTGG